MNILQLLEGRYNSSPSSTLCGFRWLQIGLLRRARQLNPTPSAVLTLLPLNGDITEEISTNLYLEFFDADQHILGRLTVLSGYTSKIYNDELTYGMRIKIVFNE